MRGQMANPVAIFLGTRENVEQGNKWEKAFDGLF